MGYIRSRASPLLDFFSTPDAIFRQEASHQEPFGWFFEEVQRLPQFMAQDKNAHPRRRVLLVRGGTLSQHSGLGGAFHDLRTSLESEQITGWESAGIEEYNLAEGASGLRRLLKRWFGHPKQVLQTIRRLHKTDSVDLIHVADQEQAHLIPKRSPAPVVVYVHDFFHLFPEVISLNGERIEVGEQQPPWYRRSDLKRLMKGIGRANGIICNTRATEALCRKHFPKTPLYRIPYGLDTAKFAPTFPLPAAPSGLSSTTCNLLVVGSHAPRKRLKFLIRTLSKLPEELLQSLMIHHIGGDSCPYGGVAASEYATQHGVPWTHVGGEISDDVLNHYRWHTEALLFPSGAEGFGYPPVESMAAGQPVLASDRPAHNELMPDGHCLGAEDEDAWRQAILEVHSTWTARNGADREPVQALIKHVEFLSPERFHGDMSHAWTEISSL